MYQWPARRTYQATLAPTRPNGLPDPVVICPECEREFDLTDETDAAEWAFGHDCEAS